MAGRTASPLACLALLVAAVPALAAEGTGAAAETATGDGLAPPSPGRMTLRGLSETGFNAIRGRFRAVVSAARLAVGPGSIVVLVNDRPVAQESIRVDATVVTVDYTFDDGLNEVLVLARDSEGGSLRADALVWAGAQTLTVDVVDAGLRPVDDALVTLRLSAQNSVRADRRTVAGVARFEHLPRAALTLVASAAGHGTVHVAARPGNVLVQLGAKEAR